MSLHGELLTIYLHWMTNEERHLSAFCEVSMAFHLHFQRKSQDVLQEKVVSEYWLFVLRCLTLPLWWVIILWFSCKWHRVARYIRGVSKKYWDWCYKIFITNWTTNQHYPLQSSSLGKRHNAGEVAPTPGSSAGSLHVEMSSAGLSRPFGCRPQFQKLWPLRWNLSFSKRKNSHGLSSGEYGAAETM